MYISTYTYIPNLEPIGIILDKNNNFYIANSSYNNIIKIDVLGNQSVFASGFDYTQNVVFDNIGFPNGYLYVMDNYAIYKVDVNGNKTQFIILDGSFFGMVLDTNNNLYYSSNKRIYNEDDNTDNWYSFIYKIDTNGNTTQFIDGTNVLNTANALAFDNIGNLFVTNDENNHISKYNSNGYLVNKEFISGEADEIFINLIIDKNNNIYACINYQYLNKYDSNGIFISNIYYTTEIALRGLAFNSIGHLFFTNYDNVNSTYISKIVFSSLVGYGVSDLKSEGYTDQQILSAGYSSTDLKVAGYNISDLKVAGYTDSEILAAGYTDSEILAAGYTDIYFLKVCKTCTDNSTTDHMVEYKPLKTMRHTDNISQKMKQAAFIRRTQNSTITHKETINFRFKNL